MLRALRLLPFSARFLCEDCHAHALAHTAPRHCPVCGHRGPLTRLCTERPSRAPASASVSA